jgi:hypothetical protein
MQQSFYPCPVLSPFLCVFLLCWAEDGGEGDGRRPLGSSGGSRGLRTDADKYVSSSERFEEWRIVQILGC